MNKDLRRQIEEIIIEFTDNKVDGVQWSTNELLLLFQEEQKNLIGKVRKEIDKYKCDLNWDFSGPKGGRAKKHTSYIALREIDKILAQLQKK